MPYSKEFYASVEAAEAHVQEAIYEKMGGYDEVIATCIGHTHIDVAWLWTIDQVRQKSCRSFATVLKLMEEYPDLSLIHIYVMRWKKSGTSRKVVVEEIKEN